MKATSKRTASKAAASVTQSRRGLLLGVLYTDRERGTTGGLETHGGIIRGGCAGCGTGTDGPQRTALHDSRGRRFPKSCPCLSGWTGAARRDRTYPESRGQKWRGEVRASRRHSIVHESEACSMKAETRKAGRSDGCAAYNKAAHNHPPNPKRGRAGCATAQPAQPAQPGRAGHE